MNQTSPALSTESLPTKLLSTKLLSTKQGFELDGELVFSTVSRINTESKAMIKNHENDSFLIDCKKLARIDSAGIALMVEWKRWCKELNKSCRIEGIQSQASALIDTYKLNRVLLGS